MKKALLIFLLAATPASAQVLQDNKSDAVKFAETGGRVAGGAFYCRMDEETQDQFIGMAAARIATLAVDKVDKVVAQLEFSNNFSLWSSRAPSEGCEVFLQDFQRRFPEIMR